MVSDILAVTIAAVRRSEQSARFEMSVADAAISRAVAESAAREDEQSSAELRIS
jgi:hypothetical protein